MRDNYILILEICPACISDDPMQANAQYCVNRRSIMVKKSTILLRFRFLDHMGQRRFQSTLAVRRILTAFLTFALTVSVLVGRAQELAAADNAEVHLGRGY
jgi:hypothetical protein